MQLLSSALVKETSEICKQLEKKKDIIKNNEEKINKKEIMNVLNNVKILEWSIKHTEKINWVLFFQYFPICAHISVNVYRGR